MREETGKSGTVLWTENKTLIEQVKSGWTRKILLILGLGT